MYTICQFGNSGVSLLLKVVKHDMTLQILIFHFQILSQDECHEHFFKFTEQAQILLQLV